MEGKEKGNSLKNQARLYHGLASLSAQKINLSGFSEGVATVTQFFEKQVEKQWYKQPTMR